MLKIVERLSFVLCLLAVHCWLIFGAVNYYKNGQAIASAHLDGHYGAFIGTAMLALLVAVVITIVFAFTYLIKRKTEALKWFAIPALMLVFALVHWHIGGLFYCCVCCCNEYVHRWHIAILAIVFSTSVLLFMAAIYIRNSLLKP